MQNLHRKAENAFFFEVYEQILCPLKKKYPILKPIINGPKDMEDLKKKMSADMNDKEIVFSKSIKAGKRIYYLDVKKNRKDEMFLAITESKKVITGEGDDSQVSFEKHKIFLYREDFQKFMAGLEEAVNFIECSDANEYIARLNIEADEENERKAIEEARENKLESEIKIDIDF